MKDILFLIDSMAALGIGLGVGIPVVIALAVLLLLLLRAQRYKRAVNDLSGRYEVSHGLLFGQISQFISRLDSIAQQNFLYGEAYLESNTKFKDLKDFKDPNASYYVKKMAEEASRRDYRSLKETLVEARATITAFETDVNGFKRSLSLRFEDERKVSAAYHECQKQVRSLKEQYHSFQDDASMLAATFEAYFSKCDSLLERSENLIQKANYDDAARIIANELQPALRSLSSVMGDIPEMALQLSSVLPSKVSTLRNSYQEMVSGGYPLYHIMGSDTLDEIEKDIDTMSKALRSFRLAGLKQGINDLSSAIQGYQDRFEEEKKARIAFESEFGDAYAASLKVNESFLKIKHMVPEAQKTYRFSEEDLAAISNIEEAVNLSDSIRRRLDNIMHSGTKQPFTDRLAKCRELMEATSASSSAIKSFLDKVNSFKGAADAAAKAVPESLAYCREAEADIVASRLDALVTRFTPAIEKSRFLVDELSKVLSSMPIDINRVIELHAELKKECDTLHEELGKSLSDKEKAEREIVKANRYRAANQELAASLAQAETFFYQGDFEQAYKVASGALEQAAVAH